ncbi:PRC-barrel domain-containing protein [Methylobacterium sp. P31]
MPLRVVGDEWHVQGGDADPVGMPVVGRDGRVAGHVRDLWVDRGTKLLRYLEIELADGRRRLMPIFFANVSPKFRRVKTRAIYAEQFAAGPELKDPDRISAREEDQISAYFAGGKMFADGVRNGAYGGTRPGDERRGGDVLGLRRLLGRRRTA